MNEGFFAAIMAACALVSARVADKAIPSSYQVRLSTTEISTDSFSSAASDSISKNMMDNPGIEYMRACTLLALTCLQRGNVRGMQQYIGTFFTLVAMQRYFDETYWPPGLSDVELEINRRVYWTTYCLDVSASAIWNGFMRSQEVHTGVRYPGEVLGDKDDPMYHSRSSNLPGWVVGWQFSIDLHRVMEHMLNKSRARQFQHFDRRSVDHLVFGDNFSDVDVMQTTLALYHNLPSVLKETPQLTGDASLDIYGYQAASIQATLQLMRMLMLTLEENHDVEHRCTIVGEVLGVFSSIPVDYLRAINTPLIYHLGTIGQILMAVRQEVMSETLYRRLRAALVTMADLLDSLGPGVSRFVGPSQALRQQVADLDTSIRSKQTSWASMPRSSASEVGGSGTASSRGPQPAQPQPFDRQQQPHLPLIQHQASQVPRIHHQQHHQNRISAGPLAGLRNRMAMEPGGEAQIGPGVVGQTTTATRAPDYANFPPELMGSWSTPGTHARNDLPPIYPPHSARSP